MPSELSWLVGKVLAAITQREHLWCFTFSDDGSVVTECVWRLITKDGICVTSEDHGQMFGLKSPVDASERVLTATQEKKIIQISIAASTSDLMLTFEGDIILQFLNISCGYEAWRATHGSNDVICLGGGTLWKNENIGG